MTVLASSAVAAHLGALALEPEGPKGGGPTTAQEGAPGGGQAPAAPPGGMLPMLLPFVILVPILFMNFRRSKKEQEARGKLKKGDRVVTQAGLLGELVDLDDRVAKVKIAPGTTVQVLASTVSPFDAAPAAKAEGASKESKPAT